MNTKDELSEKIDDFIDRFRKQWKEEGDEYHQSDLLFDIMEAVDSHQAQLLRELKEKGNRYEYDPVYAKEPFYVIPESQLESK
jgi:hypothetical protein